MKAVIVECSNSVAVALCDDGTFKKLKNKGYSIGQELLLKQKTAPNHMTQTLSICASLALVLLSCLGIGSYSYARPYSYVSLDINPSIEYALNRFDKVIFVSGINDKGRQVVSSIESDIKNQDIATALGITINQLEKDNYIIEKEYNHVIVSVCSSNDTKAQSIVSCVDTLSMEKSKLCSIDILTVSKEVKNNADSLGITPAKLALINAVAQTTATSDFEVSEWTDLTVSELETTIQQASSNHQADSLEKDPSGMTIIDSEYLSSALDDNTANDSDSTGAASPTNAGTETSSTTTDKQTNTTDNTITGSNTDESVSSSKLDNTNNIVSPAADNSVSGNADRPPDSSTSDASSTDAANIANKSDMPNQDTSSGKSDSKPDGKTEIDKNNDNSSSEGTVPSSSDSKNDTDSLFMEETSIKKDSYPLPITDTLEDSSNTAEEATDPSVPVPDADTAADKTVTDEIVTDVAVTEEMDSSLIKHIPESDETDQAADETAY